MDDQQDRPVEASSRAPLSEGLDSDEPNKNDRDGRPLRTSEVKVPREAAMNSKKTKKLKQKEPKMASKVIVTTVNDVDVLLGRGTGPNDHNLFFRDACEARKEEYRTAASKASRSKILHEMVEWVHAPPRNGRFLRKLSKQELREHSACVDAEPHHKQEEDSGGSSAAAASPPDALYELTTDMPTLLYKVKQTFRYFYRKDSTEASAVSMPPGEVVINQSIPRASSGGRGSNGNSRKRKQAGTKPSASEKRRNTSTSTSASSSAQIGLDSDEDRSARSGSSSAQQQHDEGSIATIAASNINPPALLLPRPPQEAAPNHRNTDLSAAFPYLSALSRPVNPYLVDSRDQQQQGQLLQAAVLQHHLMGLGGGVPNHSIPPNAPFPRNTTESQPSSSTNDMLLRLLLNRATSGEGRTLPGSSAYANPPTPTSASHQNQLALAELALLSSLRQPPTPTGGSSLHAPAAGIPSRIPDLTNMTRGLSTSTGLSTAGSLALALQLLPMAGSYTNLTSTPLPIPQPAAHSDAGLQRQPSANSLLSPHENNIAAVLRGTDQLVSSRPMAEGTSSSAVPLHFHQLLDTSGIRNNTSQDQKLPPPGQPSGPLPRTSMSAFQTTHRHSERHHSKDNRDGDKGKSHSDPPSPCGA